MAKQLELDFTESILNGRQTAESSSRRGLTLVFALARGSRREIERKLEEARCHVGIDLGTTNSSVAVVDALALLEGDTDAAATSAEDWTSRICCLPV